MKNFITNLTLMIVSLITCVLFGELVLRQVLNPVDYLEPKLTKDDILNHKIESRSGGHDDWGFRNNSVPAASSIVAIGDSMTYGVMAKSQNSWPAHLSRMLGKTVYNLSLGGYGPVHYSHLYERKALSLKPTRIIVGLYIGNDLADAYNLTYSKEYWKKFRSGVGATNDRLRVNTSNPKSFHEIRSWLAQNSIIYRIISQSAAFDGFRTKEKMGFNNDVFLVQTKTGNILVHPRRSFKHVDLSTPRIQEGLEITVTVLNEIYRDASLSGIAVNIALIPLRENVYREEILSACSPNCSKTVLDGFEELDKLRLALTNALNQRGIGYIDLLPSLRAAKSNSAIYPATDGHPNSAGYEVIATAIKDQLNLSN